MPPLDSSDLHRIFKKPDQNSDDYVSIDELQWLLDTNSSVYELECLAGKTRLGFEDFSCFYNTITMENSGGMNGPKENDSKGDLLTFEVFDTNHDGSISPEELRSALSILGLYDEHGEMDVDKMIKAYDLNSNGSLKSKEFKKMMSKRSFSS